MVHIMSYIHYIHYKQRHLELIYPQFPSEEDFLHRLLNSRNLQNSDDGQFMILSRFSVEWPRLQIGGLLLPYLVEFYQWLHTHLGKRLLNMGNAGIYNTSQQ